MVTKTVRILFVSVTIFNTILFSISPLSLISIVKAQEVTQSDASSSDSSNSSSLTSSSASSETSSSVSSSTSSSSEPSVVPEKPKVQVSQTETTPSIIDSIANTLYSIAPFLFTDKPDYSPTDKAVISGNGLAKNTEYTIVISSTDEPAVTHTDKFTTNSDGSFKYEYQLDGNYRPNYLVEIKDKDGKIVSTITFTDSRTINSVTYAPAFGTSITVNPGANITAQVNSQLTSNSVWHSTGWQIASSSSSFTCIDTFNHGANGPVSEQITITAPNTPGTYNAYFRIYSDNSCNSGASSTFTLPLSVTVINPNPDLTVTKTNNTNGSALVGDSFNWILTITNTGVNVAGFGGGDVVLSDQLPSSGATYGTPIVVKGSGVTGTIACNIQSNNLSCTSGSNNNHLNIHSGETVTITIPVTPTAVGSLVNPRTAHGCKVDPSFEDHPNGNINETNENNNECSNTVTVSAKPTLTINKSCLPSNDTGKFNIYVDGGLVKSDAVCGDVIGPVTLSIGEHIISESDGTDTNINDYISPSSPSISGTSCTNSSGVLKANLSAGSNVVCNVVNTKNAKITVTKHTIPATSAEIFNINSNYEKGVTLIDGQADDTGFSLEPNKEYSFSEVAKDGWTQTSSSCNNGNSLDHMTPSEGEEIDCQITNVKNPVLTISNTATNKVGDEHTFKVTFGQTVSEGFTPVPNGTQVSVNVTPDGTSVVSDTCSDEGTVDGSCTYTINSDKAGVYTATASAEVKFDSHKFEVSTSESAVKTYVDGKIVLTPDNAINDINDSHTITATVSKNLGTGDEFVEGVLVTFSLKDNENDASFVDGTNTCTTNASGECSVSINSSNPGNVKIHADVSIKINEDITLERSSNDVSKEYQAGTITIVKKTIPSESNEEFTFHTSYSDDILLKDGGSYPSGFLAPKSYSISEVAKEGWVLDSIVCNKDGQGGEDNLSRLTSVKEIENGTSVELGSGDNITCTFTNIRIPFIAISSSGENVVGTPHTFTIQFGQQGSFHPVPDYTIVDVTILPAGYELLEDTCANPGTIGGYCTVKINSTVATTYTATAKGNLSIGSQDFVVLTDGSTPNSDAAKEKYVDGSVELSPLTEGKGVNNAEAVIATVKSDSGSGMVLASGALVTFSLSNNSIGAYFVGGVNTCTTDATGTCSVQVNSAYAGIVNVTATSSITVDTTVFGRTSNTVSRKFDAALVLGAQDSVLAITGDDMNVSLGLISIAISVALAFTVSSKLKKKKLENI
ncbi:MAG: hypothetical protein WCO33_01555 [bacterium]